MFTNYFTIVSPQSWFCIRSQELYDDGKATLHGFAKIVQGFGNIVNEVNNGIADCVDAARARNETDVNCIR